MVTISYNTYNIYVFLLYKAKTIASYQTHPKTAASVFCFPLAPGWPQNDAPCAPTPLRGIETA